jgi:hypothetical protein
MQELRKSRLEETKRIHPQIAPIRADYFILGLRQGYDGQETKILTQRSLSPQRIHLNGPGRARHAKAWTPNRCSGDLDSAANKIHASHDLGS